MLDMRKHIIDTLNQYEDSPDIPSDTEPTKAERIASDKYLREQAKLPDSSGAFQREVKKVEKEKPYYLYNPVTNGLDNVNGEPKKDKNGYPLEATPKQVGELAERLERSRQMTGYKKVFKDKRSLKPKKKVPPVEYNFKATNLNDYKPYVAQPQDPRSIEQITKAKADQELQREQEAYDNKHGTGGIVNLKRPD